VKKVTSSIKDQVLKSKIFILLLVISVIVSGSTFLLSPASHPTPSFGQIAIPDGRLFDLNNYPYLERKVLGIWNTLREQYAANDHSPESVNESFYEITPIMTNYVLAFTAYGASMVADSTPSYRSPYYTDFFKKMILLMNSSNMEEKEWNNSGYNDSYYEALGNGFRGPTNIMWTGHYALMELLYYNVFREPLYNEEIKWYMDDWNASLTADTTWDNQSSLDIHERPLGKWGVGLIPCEPYIVFVQCNSIPFYAMRMYDQLHGTNYQNATLPGIDWWQENMIDSQGVQVDGYFIAQPKSRSELINISGPAISGSDPGVSCYGSIWAIMFFKSMGMEELANELYDNWKKLFVHYTDDDMAYVVDDYHKPNSFEIFDMMGNAFAYVGVREMEDWELARKIENWFYGPYPGSWIGDKYEFDTSALPGFLGRIFRPVLGFAYMVAHHDSTLADLMNPREDSFYDSSPYISGETTHEGLFIYQAYYDEVEEAFILSVEANVETILTFDNFPNVQGVYSTSGEYLNWSQNGDQMLLTLSPGTYSFVLI
jgi:hypothetical protein